VRVAAPRKLSGTQISVAALRWMTKSGHPDRRRHAVAPLIDTLGQWRVRPRDIYASPLADYRSGNSAAIEKPIRRVAEWRSGEPETFGAIQ
jgi:hypothetical protein